MKIAAVAKQALASGLRLGVGRRNMVRLGRFISNEGRFDGFNDLHTNGELLVQRAVTQLDCQGAIRVVDCGANQGQWVKAMAKTCRSRPGILFNVTCFEPSKYTCEKLRENLAEAASSDFTIDVVNFGLSNSKRQSTLHVIHDGAGRNSLAKTGEQLEKTEAVTLTTLDAFAEEQGWRRISLLKIDTEGHDLSVIRGADRLIREQRVDVIQFEYNWLWLYERALLIDAFEFLSERGYRIGKVTPKGIEFHQRYDTEMESFRQANYIACLAERAGLFPEISWWNSENVASK